MTTEAATAREELDVLQAIRPIIDKIESLRKGRKLIALLNFDRQATPSLPGLTTMFHADVKEALFRVLKDTVKKGDGIDLFLYTRGGDTNSVWPIVSIIREFDPDFEVIVPFRCHSSGTLLALGAKRIILTSMSELSPIDPTTGNLFNPQDPGEPKNRLGISVEDVSSYKTFIAKALGVDGTAQISATLAPFMARLVDYVHPLALGNVERVLQQIKRLARSLLKLHDYGDDHAKIVEDLTTEFWSHVHMINRAEAKAILGPRVVFAKERDAALFDELLRAYENAFKLRQAFFLASYLGDDVERHDRFIGAVLQSNRRCYLYETAMTIRQTVDLPPNVQVQLPVGQPMPLVPGLPRRYDISVASQDWVRDKTEPP